jgi:murein L,D-transpeptidase YcbB/YkuD
MLLSACASTYGAVDVRPRDSAAAAVRADQTVAAFYKARRNAPVWTADGRLKPEAEAAATLLASAAEDGLEPTRYGGAKLDGALQKAKAGDRRAAGQAERLLSEAYAAYVLDLRRPAPGEEIIFADAALAPPATPRAVLEAAARAPSLSAHLASLKRMNPLYTDLRTALAEHRRFAEPPRTPVESGPVLKTGAKGARVAQLRQRLGLATGERFDTPLAQALRGFQKARGLAVTGAADAATVSALNEDPERFERLILANMDRVRALPADLGDRFVLVDAASARLWMYEGGRPRDSMKVVVGTADNATPMMAGTMTHAVVRPYWNIPEDLVRDRFAPRVLKDGVGVLEREGMEALSDWSERPQVLSPNKIDWRAVAAGRSGLRVRQKPGPENMMGAVKFMFPNEHGIYLHDTPNRALFNEAQRTFSAGCVRVEDARRLARWLYGRDVLKTAAKTPEQRVDLPRPVPVYIVYLTAAPAPAGGLTLHADAYGRDRAAPSRPANAQLASAGSRPAR